MVNGGVYIALGSNLGDRAALLRRALAALDQTPGIRVLRVSRFHETEPVGGPPDQPRYLNAAAELDCTLDAPTLLANLQRIEAALGRARGVRHGPRTIDLDLLLYRALAFSTPELTVPHPRMWQRDFVLIPLAELCDPNRFCDCGSPPFATDNDSESCPTGYNPGRLIEKSSGAKPSGRPV